jgi:hypothetical protein
MEKYSSGLVSESFWFIEFKKIIKLRNDGKSWDDIRDLCLNDNLLGISKEYRARRIYGYLKNRVDVIDEGLINIFINADLTTQKIINIIAIAKKNRLFFEFLYEVYREKVLLGAIELTDSDINIFFKNKQEQDEDISKWTDVTLKRLRSTYMNFLTDAGFLTVIDKQRSITPPILEISLENYLKDNGEKQMLKAIRGAD